MWAAPPAAWPDSNGAVILEFRDAWYQCRTLSRLASKAKAHFGHEFRAFTGLTPTRYVEVRRRFLHEHPGHALDGWPLPAD